MKKFLKYISITLLLILGLCCIGVLYLFFVPNSSLFNITYANNHDKIISDKYAKDSVNAVILNSRNYDVSVLSTDKDVYYVELYSNTFGFTLKKNEKIDLDSSLNNGTLILNVKESYGFAVENNSYIKLYVPTNTSVDLTLSNLKATTEINSPNVEFSNLSYSTKKGDFKFKQGKIKGDLSLNLNKSTCTISKDVGIESCDVSLSMTTGKFIAPDSSFRNVTIAHNQRGVVNISQCESLTENNENAGGQISIGIAGNVNITAGDTKIKIGESSDGLTVSLKNSGNIYVGTLRAISTIKTEDGKITVDNCLSNLTAHTNSGDIYINNAMKTVSIKTNYGNANVKFSDDAEHYLETDNLKSRVLYATIYNGVLNASGVEHIGSSNTDGNSLQGITVTGNGRVNLSMNKVVGLNTITGKNGNVNVVVRQDADFHSVYDLISASNSGKVRVNLMQISNSNGYTTSSETTTHVNHWPDPSDPNYNHVHDEEKIKHQLKVTTNQGDITILDSPISANGF